MKGLITETAKDMRVWLAGGALAFALGILLTVFAMSWKTGPQDLHEGAEHGEASITFDAYWGPFYTGLVLTLLGAATGGFGLIQLFKLPAAATDAEKDPVLYSRHLVGLGYALLLVALVNGMLLAGMTKTKLLHGPDESGENHLAVSNSPPAALTGKDAPPAGSKTLIPHHPPHSPLVNALLVLLSVGMSLLGALFFVANSLRRKREGGERFEVSRFWGGLWYRLGEAVLFTLVCFWAVWTYQWQNGCCWLPVLGLALGMFVTSGERLVFGLGRRLFRAAEEFFPFTSARSNEDSLVRNEDKKQ